MFKYNFQGWGLIWKLRIIFSISFNVTHYNYVYGYGLVLVFSLRFKDNISRNVLRLISVSVIF